MNTTTDRPGVAITPAHPVDPTDNLTIGTIPDEDLNRLIAASAGPDVTLPAGIEPGDWQDHDDRAEYRIVYGAARGVSGRPDISVRPTAIQLGDGRIDNGSVIEGPRVHVDGVSGVPLTVTQARRFATAVMAAADELAALCPDPADPLDAVGMVQLLDEIAARVTGPGALRAALASADPAALTREDRAALVDLLGRAFGAAEMG